MTSTSATTTMFRELLYLGNPIVVITCKYDRRVIHATLGTVPAPGHYPIDTLFSLEARVPRAYVAGASGGAFTAAAVAAGRCLLLLDGHGEAVAGPFVIDQLKQLKKMIVFENQDEAEMLLDASLGQAHSPSHEFHQNAVFSCAKVAMY